MSLTYPVPLADFWHKLPISRLKFSLPGATVAHRTKGGEILPASIGTRLWQAEVELDMLTPAEWAAIRPMLHLLDDAGPSFLMSDTTRPAPADDPGGVKLAGSTPVFHAIWLSNGHARINDFPPGYQFRAGDLISWAYGGNPVRHSLHEIVQDRRANSVGAVDLRLTPQPSPAITAAAANAPVTLINAACKALIVPDTLDEGYGRSGGYREGVRFTAQQTLR